MPPAKTFKVPFIAPVITPTSRVNQRIESSSPREVTTGTKSTNAKGNKATYGQNKSNPDKVWKKPTASTTSRPEGVSTTSSGSNEKPVQQSRKHKSPNFQAKPLKESKPATSLNEEQYARIFAAAIGRPSPNLSQKSRLNEELLREKDFSQSDFEGSDSEKDDSRPTPTVAVKQTSQGILKEVSNKGVKPITNNILRDSMLFPGRRLDWDSRDSDSTSEVEWVSSTTATQIRGFEISTPDRSLSKRQPSYDETPHLPNKRRVADHRGNQLDKREKENQSDNVSNSPQASEQDTMRVKSPPVSPENSSQKPTAPKESLSQRSNVSPGPAPQRSARHSESQSLNQQSTPSTFEYSQPPAGLTKVATAEWLLDRRMNGTWVECVSCHKWRHLKNVHDPTSIPTKWVCSMNDDDDCNSCQKRERRQSLAEEAHMIFNTYSVGSLVWAHVEGYPWWPAMIDDDADYESFYWMDSDMSLEPDWYHVIFFDKPVTRAWVKENKLKPYTGNETGVQQSDSQTMVSKYRFIKKRLNEGKKTIATANGLNQIERIRKYGFLAQGFLKRKGVSNVSPEGGDEADNENLRHIDSSNKCKPRGAVADDENSRSSVSSAEDESKSDASEFSPENLI